MRWSRMFAPTLKEDPASVESKSHRLLLRAGYMRMLASGIYSLLPLAQLVRLRLVDLIRREHQAIGAQEFVLPALHPEEIWRKSGRLETMGEIMFRLKDRRDSPYVLGVTHEEIFTAIASAELKSYKQLPQIWYQFQTKFRDEARPKGGLLRVREFTMKDSYSFDIDQSGLGASFDLHAAAYEKIFERLGLPYLGVIASSGAMGGSRSVEYMVACESGEDILVTCPACGYGANLEKAVSALPEMPVTLEQSEAPQKFPTPGVRTIADLASFDSPRQYAAEASRQIKTLVYVVGDALMLLLLRGDCELSESKLMEATGAANLRPAREDEIVAALSARPGSLGAVGVSRETHVKVTRILADLALEGCRDMTTGANIDDYHYRLVDISRDIKVDAFHDLRAVRASEPCVQCKSPLELGKGLEIGHIFKLGTRYAEALGATVLDATGRAVPVHMGSYGIGVERLMAACVETHGDDKGIVWPLAIAPFGVVITPVGSPEAFSYAESLYESLNAHLGLGTGSVLLDDRDVSPGIKFNESELIGVPYRVTVGKKLKDGEVELYDRRKRESWTISVHETVECVLRLLAAFLLMIISAASAQAAQKRVLSFPTDANYGRILLLKDENNNGRGVDKLLDNTIKLAGAQGTFVVNVPDGKSIMFEPNHRLYRNPRAIEQIKPVGIDCMRVQLVSLGDADAGMLAGVCQRLHLLTCLSAIDFAGSDLSDSDFVLIKPMPNLRGLQLLRTDITARSIAHLVAFPGLTFLSLGKTLLMGANLAPLAGLKNLIHLNIAATACGDRELAGLSNARSLQYLDISDNKRVTDAALVYLKNCKSLRFLRVQGTAISAKGLLTLKGLPLTHIACNRVSASEEKALTGTFKGVDLSAGEKSQVHVDSDSKMIFAPLH